MMTRDEKIREALNRRNDNLVKKKSNEIIELKESFDKRFGTYKPNRYKVEVNTILEEEKNAEDNKQQ